VNRVRFEELLCELMNVFIHYKTRTIHLDNIVAIIFHGNYQFALSGPWQVFAVATFAFFLLRSDFCPNK